MPDWVRSVRPQVGKSTTICPAFGSKRTIWKVPEFGRFAYPWRMPKARTDTFEHTISGLLSKRADLLSEAQILRDRVAKIKNDLDALDRTLGVLGYDGDLDAMMPRQKRHVLFGRGELSRQVSKCCARPESRSQAAGSRKRLFPCLAWTHGTGSSLAT
ncbi:hypothetical protein [Oricola sp.]|uniref:hypothetical protein n=1 Tax=Oricola sp. TaxID=1979950 RepID=UPI003BAD1084